MLVSTREADLNKEYLSKLVALQSAQIDASYAFGIIRIKKKNMILKSQTHERISRKTQKLIRRRKKREP